MAVCHATFRFLGAVGAVLLIVDVAVPAISSLGADEAGSGDAGPWAIDDFIAYIFLISWSAHAVRFLVLGLALLGPAVYAYGLCARGRRSRPAGQLVASSTSAI